MDNLKIWVRAFVIVLLAVIFTIGGCNMHVDYCIKKTILAGNDPIVSRNAFSNSDYSYERIIYMTKLGELVSNSPMKKK